MTRKKYINRKMEDTGVTAKNGGRREGGNWEKIKENRSSYD